MVHFLGKDLWESGQEAQGNMSGWFFVKFGLSWKKQKQKQVDTRSERNFC